MVLKSGTDQFHGEAFESNRNTSMAASTFFANATGAAKPTLIFNDFGFNIGGPIYIPGHQKKIFLKLTGGMSFKVVPALSRQSDSSQYAQF
jgi:hypothetical protein